MWVRGATQLRLTAWLKKISPMKHQGKSQPHSSGTGRLGRSIPQLCNGSSRVGYLDVRPFASRLGGPFGVVVSGRLLTVRLLSEPSYNAYSSSSVPFEYWAVLYAGPELCHRPRGKLRLVKVQWTVYRAARKGALMTQQAIVGFLLLSPC